MQRNPVTCTAQDQCHTAGTCNPASGSCSNPLKANGATCDDGNACTTGDACQAGACAPGTNSCFSITVDQDAFGVSVVPQLAATLSSDRTTPVVPGDVADFSATVTNTGISYEFFGFLDITNSGTTSFTIPSYQQTLEYFSPQSHSWVPFGKAAFDSTGARVDDPTLPALEVGSMVGTVVPPSPQVQNFFYIVRANIPGDLAKLDLTIRPSRRSGGASFTTTPIPALRP